MPRIVDLSSPAAQLIDSYDQLMRKWHNAQESWRDKQSQHIEEEVLASVGPKVKMTLEALRRVDEFLGKAQRACGSDDDHS